MAAILAASKLSAAALVSQRALRGSPVQRRPVQSAPAALRKSVVVAAHRDEQPMYNRRDAMSLLASSLAAAGLFGAAAHPASAAYGETAQIFAPSKEGGNLFTEYKGSGFRLNLPTRWKSSKERDVPNIVLRYGDNTFDASSNVIIVKQAASKSSIDAYGSPSDFLKEVSYLLGSQVWKDATEGSEGGFAPGKVVSANILRQDVAKVGGVTYYKYDILTRTADGTEGGKHNLISAAVKDGNLYLARVSIGDKRWFKGAQQYGEEIWNSFQVA